MYVCMYVSAHYINNKVQMISNSNTSHRKPAYGMVILTVILCMTAMGVMYVATGDDYGIGTYSSTPYRPSIDHRSTLYSQGQGQTYSSTPNTGEMFWSRPVVSSSALSSRPTAVDHHIVVSQSDAASFSLRAHNASTGATSYSAAAAAPIIATSAGNASAVGTSGAGSFYMAPVMFGRSAASEASDRPIAIAMSRQVAPRAAASAEESGLDLYHGDKPGIILGAENALLDNPIVTSYGQPIGDAVIPLLIMAILFGCYARRHRLKRGIEAA